LKKITYTTYGKVSSLTGSDGAVTNYDYTQSDPTWGIFTNISDGATGIQKVWYDTYKNIVKERSCDDSTMIYTYTSGSEILGETTFEKQYKTLTDAKANSSSVATTQYDHDATTGVINKIIYTDLTTNVQTVYDGNNNIKKQKDEEGNWTYYEYDGEKANPYRSRSPSK